MGETKELKKNKVEDQKIPIDQIPANIRMPEQLSEQELRQELDRLRNVLVQADKRLKEMSNGLSVKRIEFLFAILSDGGFGADTDRTVRAQICEELGVFENTAKSE